MCTRGLLVAAALFLTSCTGVRSVQLRPPVPAPLGLVTGYGVEKVGKDPDRGRQSAHLKAIDDLLSRGPVLVTKTVQDRTTVLNVHSATRTMESTFRLRAAQMLQPSFIDSGVEDGFAWVLLGATENDIERGWREFVAWRALKIDQARMLFGSASGADRLVRLKASFELLEEAAAQDDPTLLYYEVKTALDAELTRVDDLAKLQRQFRILADSGQLQAAEQTLDQALRIGLDHASFQQLKLEVFDQRDRAARLISAGDECFAHEEYKEAVESYQQAQRLDRDHPQIANKLALAEGRHRTVRSQTVRSAVGVVGWSATKALGEYFSYKREQEARKRAEAEAEKEQAEERAREEARRKRGRESVEPEEPPEAEQPTQPVKDEPVEPLP